MSRLLFCLVAMVVLFGCAAHVPLPAAERARVSRSLTGEERFLKLSFFQTRFFADDTKRLLTPVPPDEVRLLEKPDGQSISPGSIESVFAAGTRVRVLKLEFPTPLALTGRVLVTPRTQPWLYLDVEGTPKGAPPSILVLSPRVADEAAFWTEVERYLTTENPADRLSSWPDTVREGVKQKRAVVDMPTEALEMAWGYPERKEFKWLEGTRQETWRWPGGKRSALVADGRVQKFDAP